MGRFADLCGEVAASLEEGLDQLTLPPEVWDRFRSTWEDEDIEDAVSLVRESLLQSELAEAADSLSARMVELLATFGTAEGFARAETGQASLSIETIAQIARRVARLEEVLKVFRDTPPEETQGFQALRRRLADHGIEAEMTGNGDDAPDAERE